MTFDATYKQIFLGKASNGVLLMATSGTTDLLTAGQVGIYSCPNGIEGSAISTGTATDCKIISGSWHTVDSIAQFWGGLKTSLKSRLIGWRNVTKFIKATAQAATQEIDAWGWSQSSASTTGPLFNCGTPYYFRLDFIGDPVLRLLDHQGYVNIPAYGACCTTDCSSGCTTGYVDAVSIMLQWKDFITGTQMPYLSSFVTPNVYYQSGATKVEAFSAQDTAAGRGSGTYVPNTANPQSVVASFQLTGAYQETTFGTCTFTPTDFFNLQPIQMFGSLVTQNALPCATNTTINTSVPNMYTQLQAGVQARGLGQQLARDLILSQRYRQEQFPDSMYTKSIRMRGIEDDVVIPNVTLSALYDYIALEWNVTEGRHANVTSLSSHEDTTLIIAVPTGTTTTVLTNLITSCLSAAGSNVTLQTM